MGILNPLWYMDGDTEISIWILSICSSLLPGLAFVEEVQKTFQQPEKRKPRLDSRKQLPELVWGSNQHRGSRRVWGAVSWQHKGRICYVTGWIYTFHVKHRGPSVGDDPWEGVKAKTHQLVLLLLAKCNSAKAADWRSATLLWRSTEGAALSPLNSKNKTVEPKICSSEKQKTCFQQKHRFSWTTRETAIKTQTEEAVPTEKKLQFCFVSLPQIIFPFYKYEKCASQISQFVLTSVHNGEILWITAEKCI